MDAGEYKAFCMVFSSVVIIGLRPVFHDGGQMEAQLFLVVLNTIFEDMNLLVQALIELFDFYGLIFELVDPLLIIVVGLDVVSNLFLDLFDIRLVLDDFILSISHDFVLLDLLLDLDDPILDGLAILLEEIESMSNKLVLALL